MKKLIGILVCVLLIIPVSVSASSKIINIEDKIDNGETCFVLDIIYGRIKNLSEEMYSGEIHYIFDAISINGIEIIYVPLIRFYFTLFYGEAGPCLIPKANFRGYIGDNYIIGMAFDIIKGSFK